MGTIKTLPNGESRLDVVGAGTAEHLSEGELALARPQKKDRVVVVTGEERGAAAELIGVDGAEGVLRMDATKDVSIHDMATLARVWVG
jgi:transcription elongation factor SPT5